MGNKLLESLEVAEIVGIKDRKYTATCDNICDDFCNDCAGDVAMKLKPYKAKQAEYQKQ